MTISKGQDWGRSVERPDRLRVAADDAQLAAWLDDGTGQPTAVSAGDVFTTIGSRPVADRDPLLELPIDLLRVTLDGAQHATGVAHVVIRAPRWRGGHWRHSVIAVMNAEYHRGRSVIARGHPNDGRAEVVEAASSLGLRQRFTMAQRLRAGTHLPHPGLSTRSIRSSSWDLGPADVVEVDGRVLGRGRRVEVVVDPDAAVLFG